MYKINCFDDKDFISELPNYRLADCVYGWDRKYNFYYKNYTNSIGSKYLRKTNNLEVYLKNKPPYVDHQIFYDIVMDEIKNNYNNLNNNNYPILHIRIGDAFNVKDAYKMSINELAQKGSDFVQPITFYEDICKKLINEKKNNIIIIAGIHNNNKNTKKTREYLRLIEDLLNKYKINFEYKLGGNPDEAFCLMSSSKIFIPGGGGFSRLAKHIVRKNSGKIWDSELGYF